jgi:hypothetical protein
MTRLLRWRVRLKECGAVLKNRWSSCSADCCEGSGLWFCRKADAYAGSDAMSEIRAKPNIKKHDRTATASLLCSYLKSPARKPAEMQCACRTVLHLAFEVAQRLKKIAINQHVAEVARFLRKTVLHSHLDQIINGSAVLALGLHAVSARFSATWRNRNNA